MTLAHHNKLITSTIVSFRTQIPKLDHILDRPVVVTWSCNEGVNGWKEKVAFQIVNLLHWLFVIRLKTDCILMRGLFEAV